MYDLKRDQQYAITTTVPNEKDLLASISKLAQDVREKLVSSPEMLKQFQSRAAFVLTQSVPALRAYNEGLQLARDNKFSDAAAKLKKPRPMIRPSLLLTPNWRRPTRPRGRR